MNRWGALAALLVVAAALFLRVPNLSLRPLHNDEAVNATKVAELWEGGRYKYDPDEYHGPTLHYATLPFLSLSGAKNSNELADWSLRIAPVVFGVALLFLLPLFAPGLSRGALLWTALFIAISPAMVFYSRYFIHEMLLIFFTTLAVGAGWRYTQTRSAKWPVLAGAAVGLMFATKETFVITVAGFICGMIGVAIWLRRDPRAYVHPRHVFIAVGACMAVWLLFFSSFFTNFPGLLDSVRTYFPWLKRAGGQTPHIQPWYFYFERLLWFHPAKSPIWSEALVVGLALIGGIVAMKRRTSGLHCFLAIYTAAVMCAYTIIPYKTPWCLLNFYIGMLLLAGLGASWIIERGRVVGCAALLVLSAQLGLQAYRANTHYAADRRNPYVYAQTLPDLLNLVQKLEGVAKVAPKGYDTVVKVITPGGDYWPLPWYLRRFKTVGWFEEMPADPYAPIIIVSQKLGATLDEKSDRKWIMAGYTELRPQRFLELYVEIELWKSYVATLPRPRDDE